MTPEAKGLAAARGVDEYQSGQHLSRLLTPELLRSADLVLPMTREHRRSIVEMEPAQLRRVFTIREFARLAENVPDSGFSGTRAFDAAASPDGPRRRFDEVLALLAAQRGLSPNPVNTVDDDVVDPYGRSNDVYARSGEQLDPAIAQVERVVRLWTSHG